MTKSELKAALKIKEKLTRLENRLADIEATGGIRTSLQSTGGRGGSHKDTAIVARELAEEIEELRKKFEVEKEIIRRALEKAGLDEDEMKLMITRYVKCLMWKYVRALVGYAQRQPYRIHKDALKKVVDND